MIPFLVVCLFPIYVSTVPSAIFIFNVKEKPHIFRLASKCCTLKQTINTPCCTSDRCKMGTMS